MKEQTISNLKKLKSFHNGSYGADINRAIQALEQQPCKDCVSRVDVKEQMLKYGFNAPDMTVTEFVEDCLQPVTPQTVTEFADKCKECGKMLNDKLRMNLAETSQDCISRQKALDCFEQTNTRQGAKYAIETLPSVTPQRPKGKWIETPVENDIVPVVFKCSECGMRVINPYKYCPNCGAEMSGGGEDEDRN